MALQPKRDHDVVTIQASAAKTASGLGDSVRLPGMANAYAFTLDCTVGSAGASDTCDVYVATMLDGVNWTNIVHYTQLTGTGGAKRYIAKVCADLTQDDFEASGSLAASAVRNLMGDEYRATWSITDTSGSGSFTFSVVGEPM